ncbi:MAG: hypothetical protein ABIO83_04635, partial [Ilumatobacteraceae bacterium]
VEDPVAWPVRRPAWSTLSWAAAAAVALVVLWPIVVEWGALAYLDLLVLPEVPMPRSLFWLGPDLARRFPGFVPYSAVSGVIGGYLAGRLMLALSVSTMVVGVARLVSVVHARPLVGWRVAMPALAGVVVATTPFTLTRVSTGHLTTVWALAVLPFLLVASIEGRSPARSRSCAIAGLTGFVAGAYSLVVVVGSSRRTRPLGPELVQWLLRNLIWLLPGIFLQAHGFTTMADPRVFAPKIPGATALVGLPIGLGYWDAVAESAQRERWLVAVVAVAVVLMAMVGAGHVPLATRRMFGWCMAIGFGIPLAAASPVLGDLIVLVTRSPVGSPLREPHRLVGLGLVPLVVLAVVGVMAVASTLDGRGVTALGVAMASAVTVLLWASLPTVHRRLDPLTLPGSWQQAASVVESEGGVVMVLPWSEYVELRLDHPRRVFNPLPDLFGGDVVASSDPQIGPPVNEAADPRAEMARATAAALVAGDDAGDDLARMGIGWVAVLRVEQLVSLDLSDRPSLERVLSSPSLDLYRVVVGRTVGTLDGIGAPIGRQHLEPEFVDEPWVWGWWSGGLLGHSEAGLLEGPGEGRLAVFLPAIPALAVMIMSVRFAIVRPRRPPP